MMAGGTTVTGTVLLGMELCDFLRACYSLTPPVPRVASAATWARARACGAGLSRTHQHTATSPLKGLRDPEEMTRE